MSGFEIEVSVCQNKIWKFKIFSNRISKYVGEKACSWSIFFFKKTFSSNSLYIPETC